MPRGSSLAGDYGEVRCWGLSGAAMWTWARPP